MPRFRQFALSLLVLGGFVAAPAARAQIAGPQDGWFRHFVTQDVRVLRAEADANDRDATAGKPVDTAVDANDREVNAQGQSLAFSLIGVCIAGLMGMMLVDYHANLKAHGQKS